MYCQFSLSLNLKLNERKIFQLPSTNCQIFRPIMTLVVINSTFNNRPSKRQIIKNMVKSKLFSVNEFKSLDVCHAQTMISSIANDLCILKKCHD